MYSLKDQSTQAVETTLEVNRFARRTRHLKIFSRKQLVKIHFFEVLKFLFAPFFALFKLTPVKKITGVLLFLKNWIDDKIPAAPQKRLLFQTSLVAMSTLFITSLTPGGTFTTVAMNYSSEYISEYEYPGNVLVSDEEGYLVKINPQTDSSNRVGLTDYAVHTVESGESLSVIASRYGVHVETIMWENKLANANALRVGQKLLIPPVNGISYTVQSGDSLEKVAKKYSISVDAIIAQNNLENNILVKGRSIFLPGAKPLSPPPSAIANNKRVNTATRDVRTGTYVNASSSSATPAVGKIFIFPTNGKITQGYRAGHYAFDIANRSKPAVWAAGAGTVVKVSTGTFGGGYGNHVIIDHGNGLQSLYAHLDSVNVSQGHYVNQGDVLGIMGNTGRVYGATGIHLHWEVIKDGVKQYPGNYY